MATPLRVVFDTNAFTPDTFDLLEQSTMRRLCKSGQIVPIYGHVFLEETLRAYGAVNKRDDLVKRWLPFIAETVDRFCDDFIGIWHKELVQGHGLKTNIFMARRDQDALSFAIAKYSLGWDLASLAQLKSCPRCRRRKAGCTKRNIEGYS